MPLRRKLNTQTPEGVAAEWVPLSRLRPWSGNPRRNRAAVAVVAKSIEKYGFGAPLVARLANGEVIAGHTRLLAAKSLGIERVPVRFVDLDEKRAHELALLDNKTNELASWDDDLLAQALADADEDVTALFADAPPPDEEPLAVEEVDVTEATEAKFWAVVKGPLLAQPDVLARLRAAVGDVDGVTIEIGGSE